MKAKIKEHLNIPFNFHYIKVEKNKFKVRNVITTGYSKELEGKFVIMGYSKKISNI